MKHFIIPVFIPHWGCPHQCVFCSQKSITGQKTPVKACDVKSIIQDGLERLTQKRYVEVAYYGGSFTALPLETQRDLLHPAYEMLVAGRIQGIRLSTRPDCISPEVIDVLRQYQVRTIELGVQSLDEAVLKQAGRGHTLTDSIRAIRLLRNEGFYCVAQLMIGLPGETWDSLLETAALVTRIRPDAIRIYPTVVLSGTPLADAYLSGSYSPLSLDEAVARASYLKYCAVEAGVSVIRVGLQATDELQSGETILVGPYHPSFGEMVDSYLFYLMGARLFESLNRAASAAIFHHHPRDHSKLRGLANRNLQLWKNRYDITVVCKPDGSHKGELTVDYMNQTYQINSSILSNK